MPQYKGASRQHEVRSTRRRKDTRLFGQRFSDFFNSGDGVVFGLFALPLIALLVIKVPLSGEVMLLLAWLFGRKYVRTDGRAFDFPYRVPKQAKVLDGSSNKGKSMGSGIAYLGNDLETKEQVYSGDSDLRTHMLVLGTTGSGKPQPVHANVLTPSGYRRMGDLAPGDVVCTPSGNTACIVRVLPQGEQEVWAVQTRDGRKAEGTGDHLWRVIVDEEARTVTTDVIRELLAQGKQVMIPRFHQPKLAPPYCRWIPLASVTPAGRHECRCIEIDDPEHLYITDNELVTHNTEFLLGLVFNALVQNTGCIYVDGKGDPKLQKEMFRLARYLGREDDLLIINFITSGRDFVEKQADKVTNNMNIMGNTSSGMLIELIVSLMDDSGGGGDMWKGRAISFVAALTRPLTYLRDKGYINLSPEKYLEYFELNVIEELVFEHNGKYGEMFDTIVAPLRSYLITLPGYQKSKLKKQEQKTLEQHGFIVMQLTRIFNDLTYNYGHIFKTKVGDVDFFDVVINRRILVVLLPALERAPDSMRMLGKMIVGSIKQMMAGCLGNRVEGVVREIIDSRATNAPVPFYTILDEYGYYAVIGFAVAPAQARSLGFSVIFAAQDFSSLKKSSAEEADATWENTNVRAIGRITSGQKSETWERIQGAAGESQEAVLGGFERKPGAVEERFIQQDNVTIERRSRLDYDDLAMQENGEFTFLIGKKENRGRQGGVRVIRGMGFYTAGKTPKEMRINDLLPVEAPEPSDLPQNRKAVEALLKSLLDGSFPQSIRAASKGDPVLAEMHRLFKHNHADPERQNLSRKDAAFGVLGAYLNGGAQLPVSPPPAASGSSGGSGQPSLDNQPSPAPAPETPSAESVKAFDAGMAGAMGALLRVADTVLQGKDANVAGSVDQPPPAGQVMAEDDDEIRISGEALTTSLVMTDADTDAFREKALPILRQHLYMLDGMPPEGEWEEQLDVADTETLLAMEVVANDRAFGSLEEKWAAEDRIDATRSAISDATSYIDPPTPDRIGVTEAKLKLDEFAAQCEEAMKSTLRD
ncbi:TraM recognition domain-containing protein [Xanthomonas citri]|uniref:TraM recognition domain-containing protein n=1 Tax=Xanthomonas citri TaxID=346 RepID=UPI000A2FEC5F|nr:TraM recognition domain-containing protein [Xanthomonas citri]ARR20044.1 type IV secretion protein DotL [Xanthomonas citri pv. citri]